jgi:hypothetical protein
MAIECYVNETYRISAEDLTHSDDGPVVSGATVTITLYNPDGTVNGSPHTATADGDDWSYDLTMPATPGQYTVRIDATKDSANAKDKFLVTVKPF